VFKHLKESAIKNKWPQEKLFVLDICQQIHKHSEEFYLYLAGIHQEHSDIARMWGLLAIDKCNHADTFKMVYRLKGEKLKEINVSTDAATNILKRMKTIPKGNNCNPPSIIDALRFSVKMEEILGSVHFSQVVKFTCEQDSALMASSLQSNSSILHMMTEEYLSLTVLRADSFEEFHFQ